MIINNGAKRIHTGMLIGMQIVRHHFIELSKEKHEI